MGKDLFKMKGIAKIAEPVVNINSLSRISECAKIKGDLISEHDIRVDGCVDGKLRSQGRVVVGENATIKGAMYCNELDFWGKMEGDIYVRDLLCLKSCSSVQGSIHVNKISVEVGAQINGTIHMITEEEFDGLK